LSVVSFTPIEIQLLRCCVCHICEAVLMNRWGRTVWQSSKELCETGTE